MKKNTLFIVLFICLLAMNSFAQNTFKFTDKPSNEGCQMKGKSFTVEGNLVAERSVGDDGTKVLYFAAKKGSDILIANVVLNPSQEAKTVEYHYLTKDYLEDVELSDFKNEVSIDNMYSKYKYDEISEFKVKKETQEVNGIMIGNFKNKKEMDAFKKMLKK